MRRPRRSTGARWLAVMALAICLLSAASTATVRRGFPLHTAASAQTVVLQPDASNGTDTSILSLDPNSNFGNNASLTVGPNGTTGGVARSLLSFDLRAVPPNSIIVNASLGLYAAQGGGNVQARQLLSPWSEGAGGHSWVTVPVTVRETVGVNRTLEPVSVTIPFLPNAIEDPTRDLRVYAGGVEVPSQVYAYTYADGRLASADVHFPVTLGAYQTRAFNIVYAANGTAAPAYRTRGFSPGYIWNSTLTGGGASGATIADIDGDGRLEIVFGGADGYVYCLNDQGGLKWRTLVSLASPAQSIQFTPQVADIDHSGRASILAVTNDPSVVRLNSTGRILWRYNSTALLFSGGTLVDVNRDGVLDFIVGGNMRQVIALDGRTGALFPTSYTVGGAGYWPTIADIDGSGTPEILFDGYDKNIHAYALDGTQLWAAAPNGVSVFENAVGYADPYGNGVYQAVTGDFGNVGTAFGVYTSNHTVAWSTTIGGGWVSGLAFGDLNGDGRLELVLPDLLGSIYAFKPNGQVLWPSPYAAGVYSPGSPALVDLTRSGRPDIVVPDQTNLVVLDGNGNLVHQWTVPANNQNIRGDQFTMTNPAIADLTGDGTLEIVVPTGNGMEAFSTPGLASDWRTWGYNLNHTQRALDGVSGTGAAPLIATAGSAQVHPGLGASWNYEDGATPWSMPGGDFGPVAATAAGRAGWMAWNVTDPVQGWVSGMYPNRGLMLTEDSEVTGTLHRFTSSDSPLASQRPRLTVTYVSVAGNTPPQIVGTIPDVTLLQDSMPWSIDLRPYANDTSTPLSQLRWNVTGYDASIVQIGGLNVPGNSILTIIPLPDRWGPNRVTYWLTDPQGWYARQDAWINITHVDHPPDFNPPSVLYVHYDQTYVFDFGPYISDPDTPRSALALTGDDPAHVTVSGFNGSFTYPYAYLNEWAFVNLTLSDGEKSVSRILAVKVTTDSPPVLLKPIPDQILWEGQVLVNAFNLGDYFTDPNNDALYYSTGYTHLYITIHPNRSVDIGAVVNWWGQESVTFRATDPTGAIVEDTILVTVLHIERPPSIGAVPDLRVHVDSPYSFNLDPYLSDADTPLAQLNVTVADAHVIVSGHLLTFLYGPAFNGTVQNVTIEVSDGTYSVLKTIHVAVGSDWPPVLQGKMPDTSFLEGTTLRGAYNLSDYFADPDSALLYWSAGNLNVFVTIHPNGSVDLSSKPFWNGIERVTFRATDGLGALAEDSVWITVLPTDYAPFFRPVPRQVLNTTTAYVSLSAYMDDPDNNVSELILTGTNSTHALVIGQGLLLTYAADATEYIRVVVSDGTLTNETTIEVVVSLPSSTPTVIMEIPAFLYWLPLPIAAGGFGVFLLYRYRKLEWAFLVTNAGLLVSSVSRRSESALDTDLLTGMLTTIMDFATQSFSDEKKRNLEGLELGEKRVAIVRGEVSYLAVVYRGRTPGGLIRIMRSLITQIEAEHRDALGDIVDSSKLGEIPLLLQRLVQRGSLPFVGFQKQQAQKA